MRLKMVAIRLYYYRPAKPQRTSPIPRQASSAFELCRLPLHGASGVRILDFTKELSPTAFIFSK